MRSLEKDRAYQNARYRTDPEAADRKRAQSRVYAARPEVKARRKEYLKRYNEDRRKNHPEWLARERERGKQKQRVKRALLRQNPEEYAAFLEKERQRKAGIMREVKVEHWLVERVEAVGGFCPKWVDTSRRGAPDRIVMLPGRPVTFVELKRPVNGAVSKHQQQYHRDIVAAGQRVLVLNSIEAVDEFIKSEGFE